MPYDRDKAVAAVTEFYTFLTTHLHFDPSERKTPPPTRWPEITPARFSFLGKTDTVIDLLKHLPYLPEGKEEEHIYDATKCAVYVGESADKSVEGGARDDFDVDEIWLEGCPYSPIRDTNEHITVLGLPKVVCFCDHAERFH